MSQQPIVITDDMCIATAKAADPEWDINDPKNAEDLPEIREILTAVAPQIVAAELRRIADEIGGADYGRVGAQVLHQRADELDGGAR